MNTQPVIAIAAIGRNRELGFEGGLIWPVPEDLERFRSKTRGHVLIMGRKTFESIENIRKGPLPDRTSIVITRDSSWSYPHDDVIVAYSVEDALSKARALTSDAIYIIGGAQIYAEALSETTCLELTLIDDEKPADAFFPPYDDFSKLVSREEHDYKGLPFSYVTLERP